MSGSKNDSNQTIRQIIVIIFVVIASVSVCYLGLQIIREVGRPTTLPSEFPEPTTQIEFQLVTKENVSCFFGASGKYLVSLPPFLIVSAVGKNITGEWILLGSEEFADCWAELRFLDPKGDINSLPVIVTSLPPILSPTSTPTSIPTPDTATPSTNQTPLPPIELSWKIINYDCNESGIVTSVTIDLDITGGIPDYTSTPNLPVYAVPEQDISIRVSSGTIDGEPSRVINFTVPRAADFKCRGSGNNPGPQPVITEPPVPPTEPPVPPTEPPVPPEPICTNPVGKVIPCH